MQNEGLPIRVIVPARTDLVHVLRSVTASVGARMRMSFDAVEEIKIAVDEAATILLELPDGSDGIVELTIDPSGGALRATLTVRPTRPPPPDDELRRSWPWRVLNGLCDQVTLERSSDGATIRFTKATGDGTPR